MKNILIAIILIPFIALGLYLVYFTFKHCLFERVADMPGICIWLLQD